MDFYSQRFPPFQTPFFQNLQQQTDAACMDCATECSQPSCPSVVKAITAQCTEQCVLIPCDDPQHASELICIEKETHDHCDMACDQVQDCADCGWDDLIQCCPDIAPDNAAQTRDTNPFPGVDVSSWGIDAFNCHSCVQPSGDQESLSKVYASSLLPAQSPTLSTTSIISHSPGHTPSLASTASSYDSSLYDATSQTNKHLQSSPSFQSPMVHCSTAAQQQQQEMESYTQNYLIQTSNSHSYQEQHQRQQQLEFQRQCQWEDCFNYFSSIDELIGHVNNEHLRRSGQILAQLQQQRQQQEQAQLEAAQAQAQAAVQAQVHASLDPTIFCRWRDCDIDPHTLMMSNPSSQCGNQDHTQQHHAAIASGNVNLNSSRGEEPHTCYLTMEILASHLLQDHLGLSLSHLELSGNLMSSVADDHGRGQTPQAQEHQQQHEHGHHQQQRPLGLQQGTALEGDFMSMIHQPNSPKLRAHSETTDISEAPCISNSNPPSASPSPTPTATSTSSPTVSTLPKGSSSTREPGSSTGTDNTDIINSTSDSSPDPSCTAASSNCTSHPCLWSGCTLNFPTCTSLTHHLTTVHVGSGKAQYECRWLDCTRNGPEKGFGSKQKICRHLQSHTGHRPFQCSVCSQNFSEAATLQQHMRRHTQEKPYVCDHPGCGKSFAITGALTIHKRTHNGQKPFKCTYCERAFAESSNLSKHLRTHTGARPYSCSEPGCGKSFARPDQLTRHMGVHKRKKTARDQLLATSISTATTGVTVGVGSRAAAATI